MPGQADLSYHPHRRILNWAILASLLVCLWIASSRLYIKPGDILNQDFAQLWAAGRLNLAGENPYSPANIQRYRAELSGDPRTPAVVPIFYAPPWAISLAMPLGLLPYPQARLAWLLVNIAILFTAANLLWRLYDGPTGRRWLAWLVAFSFAPTISVLMKGQVTPLVLLGLAGFWAASRDPRRDWLAGLLAALVSLKPQLVYLFWVALLLWAIPARRWKILAGAAAGGVLGSLVGLLFNPRLVVEYYEMLRAYPPNLWFTPTIGAYLRLLFGESRFWLQFIPMAGGLAWLLVAWIRQGKTWQWGTSLPGLLMASILTTPYDWTYDQVVLLVALVPAWNNLSGQGSRIKRIGLGGGYFLLNGLTFGLHRVYSDDFFVWLAPLWLVWFGLVMRSARNNPPSLEESPAFRNSSHKNSSNAAG